MIGVCVLGATGTIGVNTLDVLRRHPEQYNVIALSAHSQYERLAEQCKEFKPAYAAIVDEVAAEKLQVWLTKQNVNTVVLQGTKALEEIARLKEVDVVMAAIVGAAGLQSSLAAAEAGKKILLANKEALVMSGHLFMDKVRDHGATLLPIDSEHNAIFQCMPADYARGLEQAGINKILLTGSGGPFRELPISDFANITPAQAIAHPNWSMGKKISVDSATMMNKGLELIEACWLFATDLEKIKILLHPQSIVHSMVEYIDGSVLAQLGQPDMRTPIAHALAWPDRIESGVPMLDFLAMSSLEFSEPDTQRYPCLQLAKQAMQAGGTTTTVLNAANEVAVQAFLDERLNFTGISETVEYALEQVTAKDVDSIETVVAEDAKTRMIANEFIEKNATGNGRVGATR